MLSIILVFANCIQVVPQLLHTYKTKSVNDLSLVTILITIAVNALWTLHGFIIVDATLKIAGLITFLLNSLLLVMYKTYK